MNELTDMVRFQYADLLEARLQIQGRDGTRIVEPLKATLHERYIREETTFIFQRDFVDQSRIKHVYEHVLEVDTGRIKRTSNVSICGKTFDPTGETEHVRTTSAGCIPCCRCMRAAGHEG